MRVGAVRARADDGEVDLLMPELPQAAGQVCGHLRLAPTGEPHFHDLAVGRVRGGARPREAVEFVGVLDRAHHGEAVAQRPVAGIGQCRLQPEQMHRPCRVGEPELPVRLQQATGRRVRVCPIDPVDDPHAG